VLSPEAPGPEPAREHVRPLSRLGPAIVGIALAAALALGCGGDDDDGGSYGEPRAPSPGGDTALTVTLDPDGTGSSTATAEVRCDGAGEPPGACEALAELPDDAADPVPQGVACTQIYGGPDVVTIEGALLGEEVDAVLTREDGCAIERFERFLPVLEELFEGYRPGRSIGP